MKAIYSATACIVFLIFLSCRNESADTRDKSPVSVTALNQYEPSDQKEQEFIADSVGVQASYDKEKKEPVPQPAARPDWDKKIIKTANLTAEVEDFKSYYSSLREKVKQAGGYIAQEEQSESEYKIENLLVIKVPVDQFDNAIVQLAAGTKKINEKKIASQDVTTEIIDIKSRMEAKRQVRLRYMDLLGQAKNMEDILKVQSEINGIQEEIESAAGRVQYLGHSAVFSTINLTYYQVLNSSAKDNTRPSFGTRMGHAFKIGWSWVGELCVGLVSIWPLFIFGFAGLLLYKKLRVQKPKA